MDVDSGRAAHENCSAAVSVVLIQESTGGQYTCHIAPRTNTYWMTFILDISCVRNL